MLTTASKCIKKLDDHNTQVMKAWLVDDWRSIIPKSMDEGGHEMATVRCRSWVVLEIADTKPKIQDCSQIRPKTKFVEESKGETTCLPERIKPVGCILTTKTEIDRVPMAN